MKSYSSFAAVRLTSSVEEHCCQVPTGAVKDFLEVLLNKFSVLDSKDFRMTLGAHQHYIPRESNHIIVVSVIAYWLT